MPLKEAVICGLLVSQASSWVSIPPSGMPRHSVRRVPRYDYSRQSPRLDQISKRDLRATATRSLSPLAPSLDVSPSSVFRVSRFWSPTCFHASIRKDREVALSRGQAFMLASGGGNSEGISETGRSAILVPHADYSIEYVRMSIVGIGRAPSITHRDLMCD